MTEKADYSPEQYESVVDTGLRAIESLMDAVIAAGKERDRYKDGLEAIARGRWNHGRGRMIGVREFAAELLRPDVTENGSGRA